MGFERNDYLSWYIPRMMRGDGAINLHASGVSMVPGNEIEWPDGDQMTMSTRFEEALGRWLDVPAEELVFTPGATGGTLLALMTMSRPGDEILVENPIYEPMLRQAERLGPVRRLERRFADDWRFSLDEAGQLIADHTALVMITEPHNPSGVFSPRDDVLELARLAAAHGAILLINEVYLGYSDAPSYHGAAENIMVVSSLSKLLGAYWARLGWLATDPDRAQQLRLAHFNLGMATRPGAQAGLGFLAQADERRRAAQALSIGGIDEIDSWVGDSDRLAWRRPQGPGFGCVVLPDGFDDVALAERLHDDHGVLVVPGTWFGAPGTLRISWLQVGDRLAEGLDRLQRLIV